MTICPHCGGNACFEQQVSEDVTTKFCFGCGWSTSTPMKVGSRLVTETLDTSPSLYKDLMYTDDKGQVWFPATVTLPEKGMVFLDGTSKDNWQWAAVKAVEITKEEKSKFPKDQKYKMDTKNMKFFGQRDFMDALDEIHFFDIQVVE